MCIFAATLFLAWTGAPAEEQYSLSGKIYNGATGEPVENVLIAVAEERTRVRSAADGSFTIAVPKAGSYTVIIASDTLKTVRTIVQIDAMIARDFFLNPPVAVGGLTVTGKRDIQKVARYTMTVQELKEVPASFGDSISALTSLPGVIRTDGGFFGPLVIRGVNPEENGYYIDDIPIYNPLHFGGLHSVINNSLMADIDLYASAFPAQYGSATGAVIAINTVDNVQKFGGYTDIGLISASALVQSPIYRDSRGGLHFGGPDDIFKEGDTMNAGYAIASGRIGYLSLFVPTIYKLITGDSITSVPEYWDYQYKMKYSFNSRHSLTLLLFGSSDYITFVEKGELDKSDDPYFQGLEAQINKQAHSMGLYYTWQPMDSVMNKLIAYGALMQSYQFFNLPAAPDTADAFKDFNVTSHPYIFGLKDRFKIGVVKNLFEIRGGAFYTLYYFSAHGKSLVVNAYGGIDPGSGEGFASYPIDITVINHTVVGYLETKLTAGGLTFVPGVRSEYLDRSGETTVDPRGLVSYEFPTKTTISLAGGKYSYMYQTNPFLFDQIPQVTKVKDLKSEKAIHRAAGIEQAFALYAIKLEGFYNNFYDTPQYWAHTDSGGKDSLGTNSGKSYTYGVEVMLRKDLRENENGLYGWINYTYTRSRNKSGLPESGDPYGSEYLTSQYEQQHSFKLVAGYRHGNHTLGAKFQMYSSMPYTAITGADRDMDYLGPGERWVPATGTPFTRHFPVDYRLDIRYTHKRALSWGYVSWYFEVINVTNHRPKDTLKWDYRYPYSDQNPRVVSSSDSLTFIPNFGVEVKF